MISPTFWTWNYLLPKQCYLANCDNHIKYQYEYKLIAPCMKTKHAVHLHFNSNVPFSLKTGTIRGELIRRAKICSTRPEYNKHKKSIWNAPMYTPSLDPQREQYQQCRWTVCGCICIICSTVWYTWLSFLSFRKIRMEKKNSTYSGIPHKNDNHDGTWYSTTLMCIITDAEQVQNHSFKVCELQCVFSW